MTQTQECAFLEENIGSFVDGTLSPEVESGMAAHLEDCGHCRDNVRNFRAVKGVFQHLHAESRTVETRDEPAALVAGANWREQLSTAPWWFVSASLHALVVALAALITMAIEPPRGEDAVIMVTELQRPATLKDEQEKPKNAESALSSKLETPPTDPTSKENSDIVVPPDILAKAELSDHFETIDPDRPDNHSAFGNEDSRSFHSTASNAEPPGGGGMGGMGLEDVVGFGGAASRRSGGGFGGGNGTGTGVGSGAGHGSFGQRNGSGRHLLVKKHGGSAATENAVELALEWLAYHQEADGHWDSIKYKAGEKVDTAMTGLALLAFLGAGHTEKVGQFKDNVKRAIAWLKSKQDKDGLIWDTTDCRIGLYVKGYPNAIATMALSEAAGMANVPETRAAAQLAVNYSCELHQNGDGSEKLGWRYYPKQDGDISVSGWFVMALKSAKVAGLKVNPASFEGAAKFLDSLEENVHGGANDGYKPPVRYGYQSNKGGATPNRSAIGCLCRQFMGWSREDMQNSVENYVEWGGGAPNWDALVKMKGGSASEGLYQWYYGTLSVFQSGGDVWKKWNEGLKKALTENQCKQGDDTGSWNPTGKWSDVWGRVGQTALSALCMEVYYRYQKLAPEH